VNDRAASRGGRRATYRLRLFVAGEEPNSRQARQNVSRLCTEYLREGCQLETIDVLEDFRAALANSIFVTPALVVETSGSPVTIFGTLSDTAKVLQALGLGEPRV
jgi:circadian clock protein KaiB